MRQLLVRVKGREGFLHTYIENKVKMVLKAKNENYARQAIGRYAF